MNDPEDNDPLETLLREHTQSIEDDGFTARVLAALPGRRSRTWLRPVCLLGATVLSLGLMIWWLPEGGLAGLASPALIIPAQEPFAALAVALSLVASIVWGAAAALRWEQ